MATKVQTLPPLDRSTLLSLVGEEAAESLDDTLDALDNGAPVFLWPGDLRIEGDIASTELLAGRPGFNAPDGKTAYHRKYTILVRGNLEIVGVLTVVQYQDVFVEGDVHARSILSHTGTLVATGQLEADEVVAFACNEEGGFLHAASCDAPLLCRFGHGGWDWAMSNNEDKAEIWEVSNDPTFKKLRRALEGLGVESTWSGVRELVTSGRSAELLRALDSSAPAPALASTSRRVATTVGTMLLDPTCKPFLNPDLATGRVVCGISVTSVGHIYLCGGFGMNMCFVSKDRGETFAPFPIDVGTGLRSILVEPKAIFVCGERGMFARSTDSGATFQRIDIGATVVLQTVLRGDGALWCTGDNGAFRSRDDGTTWERLADIEGEVARPQDSVHGVLLPTDKGRLYICRDGKLRRTALNAKKPLWAACASPSGTILAVGADGVIARSDDGGKSFERSEASEHVTFENVLCVDDGRFIAVGTPAAIRISVDDGRTFQTVRQVHTAFTSKWMLGLARLDDRVLVGSDNGVVIELSDRAPDKEGDITRARKRLPGGKAGDLAKVTDGREVFWFQAASGKAGKKEGVERYWRYNGAKRLEASFAKGHLASLRCFDDAGALLSEETLVARKPPAASHGMRLRGARPRPIVTRFCAYTDGGTVEVVCDDRGNPIRYKTSVGKRVRAFDNVDLAKVTTAKAFAKEYERRFAEIRASSAGVAYFDFFEIANTDITRFDDFFKASVIAADGAGNEVVVIEEGKHAGKVFYNDHEEGLTSLEAIAELVEEEGLDPAKLGKDKLVQAMPFFSSMLAENLGGLLKGIRVASPTTYRGRLDNFKPYDQ